MDVWKLGTTAIKVRRCGPDLTSYLLTCLLPQMSKMSTGNLSKTCKWSFAQVEGKLAEDAAVTKGLKWFDIAQGDMPTSVHVELIKQGEIKDPYKGLNEYDVQVGSLSAILGTELIDLSLLVGWRG